jgi:hypothetical protein
MYVLRDVRFFEHEPFFKEKDHFNAWEFTSSILPALTFLEGTSTLPTSNPTDDKLTSRGEAETEPTKEV